MDERGGNRIAPRRHITVRCLLANPTHSRAVEVSRVVIINRGKVQNQILAGPACGQVNLFAKPNSAIDIQSRGFDVLWQIHLIPVRRVEYDICIAQGFALVAWVSINIFLFPLGQSALVVCLSLRE